MPTGLIFHPTFPTMSSPATTVISVDYLESLLHRIDALQAEIKLLKMDALPADKPVLERHNADHLGCSNHIDLTKEHNRKNCNAIRVDIDMQEPPIGALLPKITVVKIEK